LLGNVEVVEVDR